LLKNIIDLTLEERKRSYLWNKALDRGQRQLYVKTNHDFGEDVGGIFQAFQKVVF
jgi:hypothetical protein